jgi:hypothetical protein
VRGGGAWFAPQALDIAVERFDRQKWLERDSSGLGPDAHGVATDLL